jgi:hypothetical protein
MSIRRVSTAPRRNPNRPSGLATGLLGNLRVGSSARQERDDGLSPEPVEIEGELAMVLDGEKEEPMAVVPEYS